MANSIFWEFNLPNGTTWFYFALLLTLALFVRFDRFFSLRNWDLISLFLMVPGLLLLMDGHQSGASRLSAIEERKIAYGYVWLISASGYWFCRCVIDLGLEKRPSMAPNLNLAGLAAFTVVLFFCLGVVAVQRNPDKPVVGKEPIALDRIKESTTAMVHPRNLTTETDKTNTRFWVERTGAMVLHLAICGAMIAIGVVHFQDATSGMAAACIYLILPYTGYHVSQIHHVWPAVFLCWAVFTYRNPMLTGLLLGVAAGSVFFPLLLFPLWFGFYRGRGTWRFTFGFIFSTGLNLSLTALLLMSQGGFYEHLKIALSLSEWQAWKAPVTESIWTGSHWAYRLPVFVLYMVFVILTIFWPSPRHLGQVIAQTAALVIGVQFWYADQGGVYVLWYLPLLLLMVFRPNLVDRRPPIIESDPDWIHAVYRWLRNLLRKTRRFPGTRMSS